MKCSVEGFFRNVCRAGTGELQQEFIDNLKELRDDPKLHEMFFDLYLFRDDKEFRAKKSDKESPASLQQAASVNGEVK